MRRRLITGLILSGVVLGLLPAAPSMAGVPIPVDIVGRSYDPDHVMLVVNGSVEWHNTTGADHTATADHPFQAVFNTGTIAPAGTKQETMAYVGTYAYKCKFHAKMKGTVKVEMQTTPTSSVVNTEVQILLASANLPKGMYFQLQARRGNNDWKTINEGRQKVVTHTFSKTGTWNLHARMVHRNSGDVSKWSPIYNQTVVNV